MSILEMTYVSYFFIMMSVVFGVAALVMYFALDIKRCWRIVRGRYVDAPKAPESEKSQQRSNCEETEKLVNPVCESTLLLASEKTEPLETMHLVQDIVMMSNS